MHERMRRIMPHARTHGWLKNAPFPEKSNRRDERFLLASSLASCTKSGEFLLLAYPWHKMTMPSSEEGEDASTRIPTSFSLLPFSN